MKFRKSILLTLSGLILIYTSSTQAEILDCDYFDTVDLTESEKFPNGSYLYEKLVIPAELTGEYDYEILVDGEKITVPRHLRGCACKLENCVRFCCHKNLVLVEGERKCSGDISKAVDFDPYINITLDNGKQVKKHILDEFIVQRHLPVPCSGHFYLDENEWYLFENGTSVNFPNFTVPKQEYCLQPHPIDMDGDGKLEIKLVPHLCEDPPPNKWPMTILSGLTIVGLILTIFVYKWLPSLRNLHGSCFVNYLLCLLVAYTLMLADKWKWVTSNLSCQLTGYAGYFAVMAGFLWLTVISYDLWNNFRQNNYKIQGSRARKRFLIYSLYAWGVTSLLTIIVIAIDFCLNSYDDNQLAWMPGVGVYNCWIKTNDWSAMIYFYGPMSIQIIFNVTMFILTAIIIFRVMKELQNVSGQENLNSQKQHYSLFVRLFVIMGVAWTFEIFSYLSQSHGALEQIILLFDYINYAQGVIIFCMFVLKRRVLKLIMNRMRGIEPAADDECSEEEIALQENIGTAPKFAPSILT